MLIESLIVKGLLTLAHHANAALMGKWAVHQIYTTGLVNTISVTLQAGLVVGAVVWSKEKIEALSKLLKSVEAKDIGGIIRSAIKLRDLLGFTDIDSVTSNVHDYLLSAGNEEKKAIGVARIVGAALADEGKDALIDTIVDVSEQYA